MSKNRKTIEQLTPNEIIGIKELIDNELFRKIKELKQEIKDLIETNNILMKKCDELENINKEVKEQSKKNIYKIVEVIK